MGDYRHIKPTLPFGFRREKNFSNLLILIILVLVLLPFITSLQDFLTKFIMEVKIYRVIQDLIVPYELAVLSTLLNLLGIASKSGLTYVAYVKNNRPEVIFLAWNCIGWQSLMLFIVTLIGGLMGNFTRLSKLQVLAIGILGTYLVNILRLTLVVVVYYLLERDVGVIFHNYISNVLTILWLFGFLWLA